MEFKWSADLDSDVYRDALAIRNKVFVEEQGVPEELEVDKYEERCIYCVGYLDDQPVCTARLLPKTPELFKVQRVAVLKPYRGQGVGKELFEELEKKALDEKITHLILGSQNQAIGFYEKLGYQVEGDEYLDADIPYHDMIKTISE